MFRAKKANLQQAKLELYYAVADLESPLYDEVYKLGLNPDFAALVEAEELTKKATEAVKRFEKSVKEG